MTSTQKPVVALFKRRWLPGTETFIRNQQDAYSRYQAIAVGAQRIDSPLARDTDILLYEGSDIISKAKAKVFSALGYSIKIQRTFVEEEVSVVHAHFAPEGFAVAKVCKKLGIPLIVTFHGHDIHAAPNLPGVKGFRYRLRLKNLFRDAQYFIAVSEAIRERAISLGCPPQKIVVEYTGVPEVDSLRGESDSRYDVIFVGRLIPYKGAQHMLEASSEAEQELGIKLNIAVIGDGPELDNLKNRAKELGLEVDFLGHQPSEKVQRYLASSKVFCAPSLKANSTVLEGFGMVYLEAALQETPVVAYAFSGVKEAVADGITGVLVEEGRKDLLAKALSELLSNPERAASLGRNGRRRATQDFSVAQRIQSIEKIYDRLISD